MTPCKRFPQAFISYLANPYSSVTNMSIRVPRKLLTLKTMNYAFNLSGDDTSDDVDMSEDDMEEEDVEETEDSDEKIADEEA